MNNPSFLHLNINPPGRYLCIQPSQNCSICFRIGTPALIIGTFGCNPELSTVHMPAVCFPCLQSLGGLFKVLPSEP